MTHWSGSGARWELIAAQQAVATVFRDGNGWGYALAWGERETVRGFGSRYSAMAACELAHSNWCGDADTLRPVASDV
jgi:hypothetical protein